MNDMLLSELFAGKGRLLLLRELYRNPDREFSARELATAAGTDNGNTHRWLQRWESVGLVVRSLVNPLRYTASKDPALRPLGVLFSPQNSLAYRLAELFAPMVSIEYAAIFGSVALYAESATSDVDILVLGAVSELKLNALLRPLAREHGREFNASVFQMSQFMRLLTQGDAFVCEVVAQPLIHLKGDLKLDANGQHVKPAAS